MQYKTFDWMQEGIVRDCLVQKSNHFFATICANWTESMVEWTGHRMCYLYETMKEELDEDQVAEHMILKRKLIGGLH
jgi:hypothetical protein